MSSGFSSKVNSPDLNIIDSAFEAFRQANREHLHSIWRRAQDGKLDGLGEEERRLAEIMLDHSDVYFNQFEFADALTDRELDSESEVNPFMHVALHALLEKQLNDHEPIEALQFYNAMLRNKCSAHEAIHLLMAVLLKFLFPIFKKRSRFDLDGYRKLLRIYKTRKPDKIIPLLEREPDLSEPDEVDEKRFQVFDEMRAAMQGQTFKSIEEAQSFADAWLGEKNAEPVPEFLGLSPEQMHRLLNRPFKDTSDIVTLNEDISRKDIADVPVVMETVYFLKRLGELEPLKATVKGNLPRALAQEMHNVFPEIVEFNFPIMSEEDDEKLSALRYALDVGGWIKKRNQKFSLTRRGLNVVKNGFGPDDFFHLLDTYLHKFNWASRDLYPSLDIIQQGALFSFYLLHRKADANIDANELAESFVRAFPNILNTSEEDPFSESGTIVHRTYSVRFLQRFCAYFGFVTIKTEQKPPFVTNYEVQTTPLFKNILVWKMQ